MPRTSRIVIPGIYHHVTQRGNNRQDVFFADDDYQHYLGLLCSYTERYKVKVLGYCLMTNHVHLLLKPETAQGLAKAVGLTHYWYTQHINRLHERSGHLWQNRFYSCALDNKHQWFALRYVERNPVCAGMVRLPWRYPWSSASEHCGMRGQTGLLDAAAWSQSPVADGWQDTLRMAQSKDEQQVIVSSLHTGRPLGTDSFISKLEAKIGRRLRALPRGRPRKCGQCKD